MKNAILFCFGFLSALLGAEVAPTLINGTPVPEGTWQEVVTITVGNSGCTDTIVGPRVIITAAHCGNTGQTAVFKFKGKTYRAMLTQSPLYQSKDHDISAGLVSENIASATPVPLEASDRVGSQ
jgi:hypothetical protein